MPRTHPPLPDLPQDLSSRRRAPPPPGAPFDGLPAPAGAWPRLRPADLGIVALVLAAVSGLAGGWTTVLGETGEVMLYLGAVFLTAVWRGLWAGVSAAFGAVMLLNFLFAEPHFTLLVAQPRDILVLSMFLLIAVTSGLLAGRLREQRDTAAAQAEVLARLAASGADLQRAESRDEVLGGTLRHLAAITQGPVLLLTRDTGGALQLRDSLPPGLAPSAAEWQAAELALRRRAPEAADAPGWNGSAFSFLPLGTGQATEPDPDAPAETAVLGHHRLAETAAAGRHRSEGVQLLCQQAELALQRLDLAQTAEAERRRATTETLRAALLASLSHDLRTPLATILGGVTTLRHLDQALAPTARAELLEGVEQETRRLGHYVGNLLQMTRLQSGSPPHLSWVDAADVARAALARLRLAAPDLAPASLLPDSLLPDLPMIRAEAALLEQALFNLLDNAVKHAQPPYRLVAAAPAGPEGAWMRIAVEDGGPRRGATGGPAPLWPGEAIGGAEGSGLGLQITAAIAAALGGRLERGSTAAGGTAMQILLPLPPAPLLPDPAPSDPSDPAEPAT